MTFDKIWSHVTTPTIEIYVHTEQSSSDELTYWSKMRFPSLPCICYENVCCIEWPCVHAIAFICRDKNSLIIYTSLPSSRIIYLLFYGFLTFILERKWEGMGERIINVRNIDLLPPICTLTRDWTCDLDIYPDLEWNQWSFSTQDDAQATTPHWPGNSLFSA